MSNGNLGDFFGDFDWDSVSADAPAEFLALPAGYYKVVILESEVKESQNKPGSKYLSLKLQVADGKHQNRTLFANLTVANRNEVAVKIGREQIARLVKACGLPGLQDSSQFVGKIAEAKIARTRSEQYGDSEGWSNDVKGFYAVGSSPQSTGHAESVADNPSPTPAVTEETPW